MEKDFYTIEAKKTLTKAEAKSVLEINKSNLAKNGGSLHYEGILQHNYVVLAKNQDKVIAYTLLKEAFFRPDDIYVMQVAVDNNFKASGVGSQMYNYIYKHLSGYKFFTASVNQENIISQKFHKKCGFQAVGENNLGLICVRPVEPDATSTLSSAKQERFNFNKQAENLNKE